MSISVDERETDWRKAMKSENMEWTQLWLNKEQIAPVAQTYAIQTIPRLILLDGEGKIVCSTNSPREISNYLDENIN